MASDTEREFERIARQIEGLSKKIEKFVPYAIIKETSAFGNSSHVVLSKNFLDKRVGVIVLGDKEEDR